jgi:putative DNA primase/helicase
MSEDVVRERRYSAVTPEDAATFVDEPSLIPRLPALMIPIFNQKGEQVTCQLRPDHPTSGAKYVSPKRGETEMVLDSHPRIIPRLGDKSVDLWITEGILKADSAISRGLCCVGLLGVWMAFRKNERGGVEALPGWDQIELRERNVYVAFDSDVMTKPSVAQALKRLRTFLANRGAFVHVVYLPGGPEGEKVGLDDYFVAGHTLDDLYALAAERSAVAKRSTALAALCEKRNDLGNGAWFVHLYGDRVRYNRNQQVWLFWDGKRWRADRGTDAEKYAKRAVHEMLRRGAATHDDDLAQYALKCGSVKARDNMLTMARSEDAVDFGQVDFDADMWLLNVNNGTIDLRTGALRPHDPDDLITTLIPVDYDPAARSELWERTLSQVFEGREETVRYFQRATGYSLTGDVRHECFFLLYGEGRNGKGTVVETLQHLLKEYRRTTQFETFLKKRFTGGINNEFADLAGARVVVASESEDGRSFSAGVIKNLTGGDEVTTRFLYQNLFTYKPAFKIWLITNFKPGVSADDLAFWERCKVIPFKHTFAAGERNETLKTQLSAVREQQGILAWAVRGCLDWQSQGLGSCPDVEESTKAYRDENDHFAQWLAVACVTGPDKTAATGDLLASYVEWCAANGIEKWKMLNPTAFGLKLKLYPKDARGKKRTGIGLRSPREADAF